LIRLHFRTGIMSKLLFSYGVDSPSSG